MENFTSFEAYLDNLFRKSNPAHSTPLQKPSPLQKPLPLRYINLQAPPQTNQSLYYSPLCTYQTTEHHKLRGHISPSLPEPEKLTTTNSVTKSEQCPRFLNNISFQMSASPPTEVRSETNPIYQYATTPPRTPERPPQFFLPPDFCHSVARDMQFIAATVTYGTSTSPSTPPRTYDTTLKHMTPPRTPIQVPSSFGKTPKVKRSRTKFSNEQLAALEQKFDVCNFITRKRKKALADAMGITTENIRAWFQNRRCQLKKMQNNIPKS